MPYDFDTDIDNLTRATTTPQPVKDWAVSWAKSLYIAGDPADYDEDASFVDNRLVSMLASALVVAYVNGSDVATSFQLDEFSVEFSEDTGAPERKFLNMFWSWLNHYLAKGVTLQYKDSDSLMTLTTYDESIYVESRTLPEGIE